MRRRATAIALLSWAFASCDARNDPSDVELALVDLPCASLDASSGIWESAPFPESTACGSASVPSCCPWIEFEGKATVRIEHGLGATPRIVDGYIAFGRYGVSATSASGDALRIESVDDTHVVLLNNTNQRFYVRVALR